MDSDTDKCSATINSEREPHCYSRGWCGRGRAQTPIWRHASCPGFQQGRMSCITLSAALNESLEIPPELSEKDERGGHIRQHKPGQGYQSSWPQGRHRAMGRSRSAQVIFIQRLSEVLSFCPPSCAPVAHFTSCRLDFEMRLAFGAWAISAEHVVWVTAYGPYDFTGPHVAAHCPSSL
ncbi:hypothetical protein JZ751_000555 [Albula glossodonta]|uniref:Uncharacterized protein n=1 Tax=Albula glossodonta TaxID=121402 RepID=A0A8T2PW93_9TELE|nr:hypothetical protein JZ751_000555 [Albula glossodonta]